MKLISIKRKGKPLNITPKDTAMAEGYNSLEDIDLSLAPEIDVTIPRDKDGKLVLGDVKLASYGGFSPAFSVMSYEEIIERGYLSTAKYWNYYKSTGVLRKCVNMIANFTTRAGFETTIKCLDEDDNPDKPEYMEVKRKIDEINRRVNLDDVLRRTQIKRFLYGNAGWEIVISGKPDIIVQSLNPLTSSYIYPQVNDAGIFTGIKYHTARDDFIPSNRLLYFSYDALNNSASSLVGVSAVRAIERNIKIKKNLERDLLYASRSLWAPIVIYEADTRGLSATEKSALFASLKTDLKPGAIVIANRAVVPHVTQFSPDLNNLIRAIDKQDEEIIGAFGIPKALLSREKTIARATLEFSLRAFYESTIAGEQKFLQREIERQLYDPIVKTLGYADKIRIRHEWRPILDPESKLIAALVNAFDKGVINAEEFFRRLGWELDRVTEEKPQRGDENEG